MRDKGRTANPVRVTVGPPRPISIQNEALLEAGKEMLSKSVEVGRDFCKTMVTVCGAAIPIHVALVGLAAGKEFKFDLLQGLLALAGPALYLIAMCTFSYGYFPGRSAMSLEDVDSIAKARDSALERRYESALGGTSLFAFGVIATLGAAMYFFGQPDPATAPPAP